MHIALDKCLLNFHVQLILFCLFLQAVELSTDEAMLKSIYKPASDEKMSDAKVRHLLYRIVPLICFFEHRLNGITKEYAAEMVSQGCLMHARTIQRLAQEFLATTYTRYVAGEKKTLTKSALQFAPFSMGVNRNHRSIMHDEVLRARATVWMRMNNVNRKGIPPIRAHHFLEYLRTDLLKTSGILFDLLVDCVCGESFCCLNHFACKQVAISNFGLLRHSSRTLVFLFATIVRP